MNHFGRDKSERKSNSFNITSGQISVSLYWPLIKRRMTMINNLKPGARAYIIESNRSIREVTIKRISGNLCLVTYGSGGGIQIGKHRLFPDRDAAEGYMDELKAKERKISFSVGRYDY